ncbi:MAG: Ig-like domain-containing protein [Capnocytophaga sp.]|nr:Ig-like domain-containing protein [Capnocytophaga sp.]
MIRNLLFWILLFTVILEGFAQEDSQVPKQVESTFEKARWAETLEDITELPIGIREAKDGVEYAIVITQATFLSEQTLVNAYARLTVPDSQSASGKKHLYFGATGLSFSYQGQIVGDMRLSLLGDLTVSSNKNWSFLLKGGSVDTSTGDTQNDATYITFDCEGVKEIALNGLIRISQELVVPVHTQTLTPMFNKQVEALVAVKASHWNNMLLKVSLPPFAITKQALINERGAFVFSAEDVILDMSDVENATEMFFPKGYEEYLVSERESWRGFYIGQLRVTLPEEFKQSEERVSFTAEKFLLDSYGVSGSFSVENLITDYQGTTSGGENAWRYSLDFIQADFVASKIQGGALSGAILLPIQTNNTHETTPNTRNTASQIISSEENFTPHNAPRKEKGIRFSGVFTDDDYILKASSLEAVSFDLWNAKVQLAPSSYVELRVKNKKFVPKVVLDGTMSLQENDTKESTYQFSGISFRKFTLQTEAPYISAAYFGAEGEQRLANFPVSVKDINVQFTNQSASLNFGIRVGLQEQKFSAEGGFSIHAKRVKNQWVYDTFDVSELALNNVDVVVATVSGRLQLMKNDRTYGNGFKAMLAVTIDKPSIELEASAVFGNKDFRYWGFDAAVDGLNIPAGYITITGFVGGAYYRMRPKDGISTHSENGTIGMQRAFDFVPDPTMGIGLKAGILGAFQDEKIASFMAVLSVQTNQNGGLARIGIDGEAAIMYALQKKLNNPFQSLQEGFTSQVNSLIDMEKLKKNDFDKVLALDNKNTPEQVTVSLSRDKETKKAPIYATMSMSYDFSQKAFHANMETYINVAGGIIKGTGTDGLAGRAVIHIDPQDWYIHIGTSREMMGLQVGFGNLSLKAQTYFMVGTKVYETPQPPAKVAEILGLDPSRLGYMQGLNQLGEGKGFAFGAHLNFDTGDINAGFIYARFAAGLGADMMLRNYENVQCKNRTGEIGINGWYANGQTYVYLQGELGIKVRLFFVKKNIPILKAGVAATLQGSGPNPFWTRGYLGGYYNVLGGLVKGRFRLKMEFGEQCERYQEEVLGGMKIISDVSPSDKSNNVDVFISPQVSFNLEIDKPIVIPEDDGDHTYIVKLEKFQISDLKGNLVEGKFSFGKTNDVLDFTPKETLPSNTQYKVLVEVSFQELKNGNYQTVLVDGKKAVEIEERTFTTGMAPEYIPNKNILYAYPVLNQQNYFTEESKEAFIQLKQGQAYLFETENWNTELHLTALSGEKITLKPHYDAGKQLLHYDIPKLKTAERYTLSIVSFSKNKGMNTSIVKSEPKEEAKSGYDKLEEETTAVVRNNKAQASVKKDHFERLTYSFKTSKYKSLKQKVNAFKTERKLWIKVSSDVVMLQNNMNTDEPFESIELLETEFTNNQPLLYTEAILDDSYDAVFSKYLYSNPQALTVLQRGNTTNKIGFPPKEAISVFDSYAEKVVNQTYSTDLKKVFPYRYDVFIYYKNDWVKYTNYIANKRIVNIGNTTLEEEFMQTQFPVIPTKKYKAVLKYRLPNGKITSEIPYYYEF